LHRLPVQFLIAGLTASCWGALSFNWQLNDSYFVVAHFHFTLVGGFLTMIFAGVYYWFPKATGHLFSETLGKWHFWLFVLRLHLTFDTMHIPGILGMPRRIYTYESGRGWGALNFVVTMASSSRQLDTHLHLQPSPIRAQARRPETILGCLDPRVVRDFTAAGIQFR